MKKLLFLIVLVASLFILIGCRSSDRVSYNISRDADEFKIQRRIVFYNSIQDVYILEIVGNCSIEVDGEDNQLEVTCKIGEGKYQKHFLGLSDNVTYSVEQLEYSDVNPYKYTIVFNPEMIIPIEIDLAD